jgi:hypothetical protein
VRQHVTSAVYRVVLAGGLALFSVGAAALANAQTTGASPKAGGAASARTVPRTPDGHPDLQGLWDYRTATPLERPRDLADKAVFTDQEARAFEARTAERRENIVAVHPPFWLDYGSKVLGDRRTSLIVDPPTGRVPPLTPAARARIAASPADERTADDPEQRSIQERCLVFGAGPPMLPGPYNNNVQIIQTAANVVVMNEMIHDARIIPTDGRPHVSPSIRQWLGDSRGRWDGDTLVVETTNFTDRTSFRGSDQNLRVIERFTRAGADTLMYEFTIDDPTAFSATWTARFPMTRSSDQMYEYACHEGNFGLLDILKGARFDDGAGIVKK